ncbi:transcriptional repressor NrdR [Candidatus Woesearchaeota archaeon]|nr:MAG: transcriptional repressor NrdR [Candidatus Woesearchaeota archaeon]
MKCPYCSHSETKVLDSRDSDDLTRRRRECLQCEKRFTTYERIENVELTVIKKDGKRQQFDRNKIVNGFLKACEKRPITREAIEQTVDAIEKELRQLESVEIPSKEIGELVMKYLNKLDKVAYIRFASVYREFTDLETFEKELKKLLKKEG